MSQLARLLITTGIILIAAGILVYFSPKIPWLGKLPGDYVYRKGNFTFIFPLASCIVISLILSLIMYLWNHR